jgi:hypothetical protein
MEQETRSSAPAFNLVQVLVAEQRLDEAKEVLQDLARPG